MMRNSRLAGGVLSVLILGGCATDPTNDPRSGGFFGGVHGLAAGDYEMRQQSLQGQLTATLHLDAEDTALGRRLMPVLERKAGRVLANGYPTGVEVCDAMVHGGPYPASTNFGATSVGTLSIRRFLRPVSYQNNPAALMPADFQM